VDVLDFATKYFAVLSAAAVAVGSSLVVIFIYGYLAVFDWNLIWIIEYQDITKFTLIVIALGVTVVPTLSGFSNLAYSLGRMDATTNKRLVVGGICVFIALAIWSIWDAYYYQHATFEYFVTFWLLILITVGSTAAMIRWLWPNLATKTWLQQAQAVVSVIIFVFFFGRLFGLNVRDVSGIRQDVYTSGETLTDQKIVILLSHHSIFYKDGIVTVVQSADIKKIVLKPVTAKP
jgi:hypothetical protein